MPGEKDFISEGADENLKSEEGVIALMRSSRNESEWNANCNRVKAANNRDYPPFWYQAIILSGVATETKMNWGS